MDTFKLLSFSLFICLLCSISCDIHGIEASHQVYPEYQSLDAAKVKPLLRTGYHFQPPKHWINDN
ncbi:hypothetical protein TorRG33x02_090850 [Trema orientale]|uniref:Uncharacterized protein n=1 Tax=Trema orientale TaxID=63057 RepID=A0A2P5FBM6_TREOI|nr:hypothetical protein TorRG33x02_090850 [Trema orientale]